MTEAIGPARENGKREAISLPPSNHQEHMALLRTMNELLLDAVKLLEEIAHNTKPTDIRIEHTHKRKAK